ncbi:hypothetical protein L1987_57583 [Smallanthus sonchifolius]|uniref:Uncharacterized protein n=1 Tax=Smallanthus sonchifolius TaxID=185202 RepID=A0ACB9DDE9_9ASTR|nr:hypothetical protein L1987_57583 [Smallanthus sonchifolius]
MADQNIQNQNQNQDLSLVLSSDAKPRLKWTPELHQRFVDAVAQLGGPERYNSSTIEMEVAKAELSQLVSMVDNGCPSSLSIFTELEDSSLKTDLEINPKAKSSLESSLTSSESSGRNEKDNLVLSLMEMNPANRSGISNSGPGRKRSGSTISDGNCELSKSMRFDLNSEYVNDVDFDFESRSTTLDLNSK